MCKHLSGSQNLTTLFASFMVFYVFRVFVCLFVFLVCSVWVGGGFLDVVFFWFYFFFKFQGFKLLPMLSM